MRILLFTFFILLSHFASSQNCFNGWKYYRTVTINNPSTESLTDAQIRIDFDSKSLVDSSKLQMNGADLRITDESCNAIPFYIDKVATDSANAIWVKIPSLPANDALVLQLYYGNDTANSVIDGDNTFLFFDDFAADTVNTDKWEAIGGFSTFQVEDGILEYASNGMNPGPRFKFARTKAVFAEEVVFDFNARISNSNGFGFSSTDTILERIIFRQSGFGFDTMNQVAYNTDTTSNGVSINQAYPLIRYPRGEYRDASIRAGISNTTLRLTHFANLNDSSINADTLEIIQSEMSGFHFIVSSFINMSIFLDYLHVRKPYPDTVNAVLGEEETIIQSSISFPGIETEIDIYPNPTKDFLRVRGLERGNYSFKLINLQGQQISLASQTIIAKQEVELSIPAIPNALYWLIITNETNQNRVGVPIHIGPK